MIDEPIRAASEETTAEDLRLRKLVTDLIEHQNQAMVDLARNMLTITFTAVAVVLTLKRNWVGSGTSLSPALVVAALVALFCSVPLYCAAVRGYRIPVSPADYQDVEAKLGRLATVRSNLVNAGMGLTGLAAVLLTIAVV